MTEPVILAPNLQINQNLIPYDDLDIQGDFGRKQRYPHDVLPTITALEAIDTNKQPRMLKSTPDGHLIVHPDVSSGGGGGGGLWTPKVVSGAEFSSVVTDDTQWTRAYNWRTMTTIYAMDIYIEMTGTPLSSNKNRNYFGFTDTGDSDPIWWAFIVMCGPSAAGIGGELPYNSAHYDFGTGLILSDYLNRPLADGIWVQMNNKQAPVHATVTLYGD